MTITLRRESVMLAIVATVLFATDGPAQVRNSGLAAVDRVAGQLIYVEDHGFHETLMRCVRATDLELVATDGGHERHIAVTDIRRVSVSGDSVRNGTLLGGLVGIVPGYLGCQGASGRCSVATSTVVGVATFASLGAWIDARQKGRTVLFETESRSSPRRR